VTRLVTLADVGPGDLVLDIGAGSGAITQELVRVGARVVAVELHPQRAAFLRARFDGAAVKVVRADAADLRLPRRPFKVVANPPFSVTVALLRRLTASSCKLQRASIVLPTWAVARWVSGRGVGTAASARAFVYDRPHDPGTRVPARAAGGPRRPADPVATTLTGYDAAGFGSLGIPRTRSLRMLRWISFVPAQIEDAW
jgi:23S rRNA (adenine-N6)-dimethyltransferase